MPRAHRDEILTRLRFGEQSTRLRLRTTRPISARAVGTKDVVAVARDDVHWSRRCGRLFQPGVYAEQLAQSDNVFVIVVLFKDAFVVGARFPPEVGPSAGTG